MKFILQLAPTTVITFSFLVSSTNSAAIAGASREIARDVSEPYREPLNAERPPVRPIVIIPAIELPKARPTNPAAVNGPSKIIPRVIPMEPIPEHGEPKPPPEVVPAIEQPKPQPDDNPPPEQRPVNSPKSRNGAKALSIEKLKYFILGIFRSTNRPKDGTSAVVTNRVTGDVEFVIGWKDMITSWEDGRGVLTDTEKGTVSDPTQDILTTFPVNADIQRYQARDNNLESLKKYAANPWISSMPIDPEALRARSKEGIKFAKYMDQAREQALRENRNMVLVRLGMPKEVAATYKPDGLFIIPARSDITPGDPAWKQGMFRPPASKTKYGFERVKNHPELRLKDPSVDPYILRQFDIYNPESGVMDLWTRPPIPKDLVPWVGPDNGPPSHRANRRDLTSQPNLPNRQVNLGDLYEDSSNSSSSGNILTEGAAQFKLFYSAFQAVQQNISTLIFPFLQTMVNGSNATVLYHAAWSIWADLTMSGDILNGPFSNGLNRITEIEDDYARANNLSTSSDEYKTMLALDGLLINKYEIAWNNSLQAVNASGLLDLRNQLSANLQVNETGIESADFDTVNTDMGGIAWFLQYDIPANVTSNSTDGL